MVLLSNQNKCLKGCICACVSCTDPGGPGPSNRRFSKGVGQTFSMGGGGGGGGNR